MDAPRPGHVYGALDLANRSGAVVGEPFYSVEAVTWVLGQDDSRRHDRFLMLRAKLKPWLLKWRPRKVFIEEPMAPKISFRAGSTIHTQISLTGYVAIAEMICAEFDIPTKLYSREAVLQHFTGCKGYKEKEDGKRACVMRCRQLKYNIEGYDEADAAALWDLGCANEFPRDYAMVGIERPLPAGSILSVGNIRGTRKARGSGKATRRRSLPLFKGQ